MPAYAIASFYAWIVASVFGEISPKIRMSIVRIPVAIPAPTLPNRRRARVVAMLDADRLTILFPIKMALSILPESSVTFNALAAFLFPSSASVIIRIRLNVVSAVSAEEKNADKNNRTTSIINWIMSSGFNVTPLNYFCFCTVIYE